MSSESLPPDPQPDKPRDSGGPYDGITTYVYSSFAATKGLRRRERRLAASGCLVTLWSPPAGQGCGGGTRGPSSRPRTPSPFPLPCSPLINNPALWVWSLSARLRVSPACAIK